MKTFTEEQKNKFKELRNGETEQSIIKFVKDFIDKTPSDSDFRTFLDFTSRSDEAFTDFVRFVNCFDRESKSFGLMRDSIIWGMEHHTKYEQYYRRVAGRQDNKESRLLEKKDVHLSQIASDNLILKGIE